MDLKALFSQLAVFFGKLNQAQKIIIGAAVAGIVVLLMFLAAYASGGVKGENGGYQVLFEQLSSQDAARVVEQLERDHIPYRIPRENVIEVPKEAVYKERITIASMGIPKEGHVGFELFDKQEFGASAFEQEVKFRRALEGELARSIDSLAPVEKSSVSLALPKETLFVTENVLPSASVMVQLYPDLRLTSRQILGIKKLVAAAVPKLTPENVALINSEGETLGDDDAAVQAGELSVLQQQYKAGEEKKQEEKIINDLAPFIGGKDRVVAKVTIEYDFSEQSSTSEVFDPDSVVRSEQTLKEKRQSSAKGQNKEASVEKYEKTSGTADYEISKTVSTKKLEFARIKRMTAAVVVDGKYKPKKGPNAEAGDEVEYVALDETQLKAIDALVKQSIGIDEARGDQVSVRNFEFQTPKTLLKPKDDTPERSTFAEMYLQPLFPFLKYFVLILVVYFAYRKIILPLVESIVGAGREGPFEKPPFGNVDDEELGEKIRQARIKMTNEFGSGENSSDEGVKYEFLLEKVRKMAQERPEELASLIKALIKEESAPGFK